MATSALTYDDNPERDKALAIPYEIKFEAVRASYVLKQPVQMLCFSDNEVEFDIRSVDFVEEVAFNEKQKKAMKKNGIKEDLANVEHGTWCEFCIDEDYFWCDYRNWGEQRSCPEHEIHCRKDDDKRASAATTTDVKPVTPAKPNPVGFSNTGWNGTTDRYAGWTASSKPSTTTKPTVTAAGSSSTPLPYDMKFRCRHCWHWFDSESKLAGHVTWCCPGLEGENEGDLHMVMPCVCTDCHTFEDRLVSRKPKDTDTASPDGEEKED